MSAVRWGVTLRIVWAWVFTIPGAGLTAGAAYFLINLVDKFIL
jgi:PiT family inorganic phosphate transporter